MTIHLIPNPEVLAPVFSYISYFRITSAILLVICLVLSEVSSTISCILLPIEDSCSALSFPCSYSFSTVFNKLFTLSSIILHLFSIIFSSRPIQYRYRPFCIPFTDAYLWICQDEMGLLFWKYVIHIIDDNVMADILPMQH